MMEINMNTPYFFGNTARNTETRPSLFATARVEFDSPHTFFDFDEHGQQMEAEARNLFEIAMELKHGGAMFDPISGEFVKALETGLPLVHVNTYEEHTKIYIPLHTFLTVNDLRKVYKPYAHVSIARFIPNFPGTFSSYIFNDEKAPELTDDYYNHNYKYAVEFPLAVDFSPEAVALRNGDFKEISKYDL